MLKRSAGRVPGRVALHFGDRRWTYRELDDGAGRVAAALLGLGLVKGDRVAAFGKNSDAYLLLYLGCARAGLVHVPVNYTLAGGELAYLVAPVRRAALFADPALRRRSTRSRRARDRRRRCATATTRATCWPGRDDDAPATDARSRSPTTTSSSSSTPRARPPRPRARC